MQNANGWSFYWKIIELFGNRVINGDIHGYCVALVKYLFDYLSCGKWGGVVKVNELCFIFFLWSYRTEICYCVRKKLYVAQSPYPHTCII